MFFKSVISCFNLCLRICCINSLLQSWSRAYKYHMLFTNTRFLTVKQYNNTYGLYLQCPFSPTWFHSSWWAFFLLIKKLLIFRFPSIISEKTKMNISTCTSSNILQKIKHNFPPNYIFIDPMTPQCWPVTSCSSNSSPYFSWSGPHHFFIHLFTSAQSQKYSGLGLLLFGFLPWGWTVFDWSRVLV